MARSTSSESEIVVLAVETSCDETAIALVEARGGIRSPRFKILKETVASQIKIHQPFGGVVPNLAKREHQKNLPVLLRRSNIQWDKVDLIAVTVGPGLEPALWAGITFAQELAKKHKKPLIGVNHLEGHLYSFLLPKKTVNPKTNIQISKIFPAIALIVSGGHTVLLLMKNLKTWKKLGETRDDAVGEAFDKVARMLRLSYPGGPELEKLAKKGRGDAIPFPRPMLHDKSYDFSFSGLKTAVLYHIRDNPNLKKDNPNLRKSDFQNIAASFQKAAVDVLVAKTVRAAKEFQTKSVILSGGVAANTVLRKALQKESKKIGANFFVADHKYNTDNAAIIAAASYFGYLRKKKYPLRANGALGI